MINITGSGMLSQQGLAQFPLPFSLSRSSRYDVALLHLWMEHGTHHVALRMSGAALAALLYEMAVHPHDTEGFLFGTTTTQLVPTTNDSQAEANKLTTTIGTMHTSSPTPLKQYRNSRPLEPLPASTHHRESYCLYWTKS